MTLQGDRPHPTTAEISELPCLCANLRRAARLVSQFYEMEAGWSGLHLTQFSVLQAVARRGTITHGALGLLLGLDQTTVSRALAPLRRKGWVGDVRGKDRRERLVTLTATGRQQFERAEHGWRRAQARLQERYGANDWKHMQRALTAIVAAIPSARTFN